MWNSGIVNNKQTRLMVLFACVLPFVIAGKTGAAENKEREVSRTTSTKHKSSGPYCGLYCVYTILQLAGQRVPFVELLKPEYIGSRNGSSLAELKRAAEDHGLQAIPARKITSRVLRSCRNQIILHVKAGVDSKEYDHYELFLGTENGKARVFNPPEPVKLVAFQELMPRCDGNGLVVSTEPIDLRAVFAPARKQFFIWAAVAIVASASLLWAKRRIPKELMATRARALGLSAVQGALLCITALVGGLMYHFARDEGLLANSKVTDVIQQAHTANFIPKTRQARVRNLLKRGVVLVDARFTDDYQAGHLDGALSIPVDANDVRRHKIVTSIPRSSKVVVYCQSAGCKFADNVAVWLKGEGFSDVVVYRGGWLDWVENAKSNEGVKS